MPARQLIDMSVAEIMAAWPQTISVFVAYRLHCIGCPIGPFHTLVDASAEHHVALDALVADVAAAIADPRAAPASGRRR